MAAHPTDLTEGAVLFENPGEHGVAEEEVAEVRADGLEMLEVCL